MDAKVLACGGDEGAIVGEQRETTLQKRRGESGLPCSADAGDQQCVTFIVEARAVERGETERGAKGAKENWQQAAIPEIRVASSCGRNGAENSVAQQIEDELILRAKQGEDEVAEAAEVHGTIGATVRGLRFEDIDLESVQGAVAVARSERACTGGPGVQARGDLRRVCGQRAVHPGDEKVGANRQRGSIEKKIHGLQFFNCSANRQQKRGCKEEMTGE